MQDGRVHHGCRMDHLPEDVPGRNGTTAKTVTPIKKTQPSRRRLGIEGFMLRSRVERDDFSQQT